MLRLILLVGLTLLASARASFADPVTWTGATSTDWHNPANWNPAVVPGPNDTAIFNSGAAVLSTPVTIQGLSLNGGTIDGPAVAKTLTVTGSTSWQGGTVGTGVALIVPVGGNLDIFGAGQKLLLGSVTGQGTGSWSAGDIRATGGVFRNEGTFTIPGTSTRQFIQATAAVARFENVGQMTKSGTHTFAFSPFSPAAPTLVISNTGTVRVTGGLMAMIAVSPLDGTFDVSAGARLAGTRSVFSSACVLTGAGRVELTGGASCAASVQLTGELTCEQVTFPIARTVSCSFIQVGNVLNLGGDLTVSGPFEWRAGDISGSGKIVIASGASCLVQPVPGGATRTLRTDLVNNGVMNITTSGITVDPVTITNNGVINASSAILSGGFTAIPATLLNPGVINVSGAGLRMEGQPGGCRLVNTGQLVCNGSPLYLSGGSSVQPLELGTATLEFNGGFTLPAPAGVVSASAVTLRGSGTIGPGSITCGAATIGAGTLTITSPINTATLLFQNGADTTIEGPIQVSGATSPTGGVTVRWRAPLTTGSWNNTIQGTYILESPQTWGGFTTQGVITGPADLTIAPGTEAYLNGAFNGPGRIIIAPGATGRKSTFGTMTTSRSIMNQGTFLWSGGEIDLQACAFENAGILQVAPASVTLLGTAGVSQFNNTGEIRVANGSSPGLTINAIGGTLTFVHTGLVTLSQGSQLQIFVPTTSSGSYDYGLSSRVRFAGPTTITAPLGTGPTTGIAEFAAGSSAVATAPLNVEMVYINGGQLTLEVATSLPYVAMSTGRIAGAGDLELTGDYSSIGGGTIEGSGQLHVATSARVNIDGGGVVLKRHSTNWGTIGVARGSLIIQDATFTNSGMILTTATNPLSEFVFKGNAAARFINSGQLIKTGVARLTFGAVDEPLLLSNPGRIDVTSGVMSIASLDGYLPAGTLSQGVWNVDGAASLILPSGTTCKGVGPGCTLALVGPGPGLNIFGSLESIDGTLRLGPSTALSVTPASGMLTNRGELALGVGSALSVDGSFTQTSNGLLRISMSGTAPGQFGRLAVTGTASLAGAVVIEGLAGFAAASCNASSVFLTAGAISGGFQTATPPGVGSRVSRINTGASAASVSIRNPADVATLGGGVPSDGILTADDLIVFLQAFFAQTMSIADIATLGGALAPDGQLSPDDVIAFLGSFFAGCQ